MGIGWVQELVARLTKTPISVHNSSTNGTLDNNAATFPLDQSIYVDATHDTIISTSKVFLLSVRPVVNALQSHRGVEFHQLYSRRAFASRSHSF